MLDTMPYTDWWFYVVLDVYRDKTQMGSIFIAQNNKHFL